MVANRSDYSPDDLHIYVFMVITDKGLLDLLAYSEKSYSIWTDALEYLVNNKQDTAATVVQLTSTPLPSVSNVNNVI